MNSVFRVIIKAVKVYGLLLFSIATSFCVYGQEEIKDDEVDDLIDELFFSEQQFVDELLENNASYNFVYTNISYNNQTYFSGRDIGVEQFNLVPQISYYHSSGFNASISGIYYDEFDPNWDFTSVSLGYFNTIDAKKQFNYNIGYTKYFYTDGTDSFTNSIDVSVSFRNQKRSIGTSLSVSYLFGSEESYQFVSSSFVNINLKRTQNFAFRFRPAIRFIFAKQSFAIENIILDGRIPKIETTNYDVFDLFNSQLHFPLSFSTNSWDVELGYTVNFPNEILTENDLETTGFFTISVGCLFDLSK